MAEKRKREKLIQKYKTILSGEEDSDLIKRPKSSIDPDNNASSDFNNNNNGINMDIIEIKERITKLEETSKALLDGQENIMVILRKLLLKNENDEQGFLKHIIKEIVNVVFSKTIYADKSELRVAAETYLKTNHEDFFKKFSTENWHTYYDEKIHTELASQFRSIRGTFSSKVRDAIFNIFGENQLPRVTTADSPIKISEWKKKPEVEECYKSLFKDDNEILSTIVDKVFANKKYSNMHMALVIAIATTYLNPKSDDIKLNETGLKKKVKYFLEKIKNRERIEQEDDVNEEDFSN